MTDSIALLTDDELKRVVLGEKLNKDYFYIPNIYYHEQSEYEDILHNLRFDDKLTYASKVSAGETLRQAIRNDLEKDFKFPHQKNFDIDEVRVHDTAITKNGTILTRVFVSVDVRERLSFEDSSPRGLHPKWHDEVIWSK